MFFVVFILIELLELGMIYPILLQQYSLEVLIESF